MRQAIQTKYLGPTNYRGARVKASAEAGSVTLSWDHALNVDRNHMAAAQALATKLESSGLWVGGALPGPGYAYVNTIEGHTGDGWPAGTAFEID